MKRFARFAIAVLCVAGLPAIASAQARLGAGCSAPPRINCPEANCQRDQVAAEGNAVEPKTGRKFFLDYPCDLKPNEPVVFVLSLHGAGSIGNWQRHYFPIVDLKEKYRLVVATPTAATSEPTRRWVAEADDAYLQNLVDAVFDAFGRRNIKSFWLAGHSQGGITSRRVVCAPYFRDRVDGFLSLSGGRIGQTPVTFGRSSTASTGAGGASAAAAPAAPRAPEQMPDCDFSFIFTAGQLEIAGLPATSPWAQKYACGERVRRPDVVDSKPGYVTATDQSRGPSWGRFARPGTSEAYVYPNCRDGRVVADFVRVDKGHTEGLEPNVLDEIVKLMVSARGGKAQIAPTSIVASQAAPPAQPPAAPQPAAPPAQAPQALTYELAQQILDAAEAEARRNKWNVTIVVTDAAGVPVMLRRLNGATPRSYDIAMRKTATVVATRLTTAEYAAQLKAGTLKEVPNGTPFAGGVPLMRGTEFIGAIGTSGVRANEDEIISKVGASVVK